VDIAFGADNNAFIVRTKIEGNWDGLQRDNNWLKFEIRVVDIVEDINVLIFASSYYMATVG